MALFEADKGGHGAIGDVGLRESVIVIPAEQVHQGATVLNPVVAVGGALGLLVVSDNVVILSHSLTFVSFFFSLKFMFEEFYLFVFTLDLIIYHKK